MNQPVAVGVVRVTVEIALFGRQPVQEGQIRVTRLHAVFARQVGFGGDLLVVANAVRLDYRGKNFRYGLLLENAPIGTQGRTRQSGLDHGPIAGAPESSGALFERRHQPMNVAHGLSALPKREQGRLVQHQGKIHRRIKAG